MRTVSKQFAALHDASCERVSVAYSSLQPDRSAPAIGQVEAFLRGLRSVGCRPRHLLIRVDDEEPKEIAQLKALAVLAALRAPHAALAELRLHGVPLTVQLADALAATSPGLTKLSLSGASVADDAPHEGVAAVLQALPSLAHLALWSPAGVPDPTWQALAQQGGHVRALDVACGFSGSSPLSLLTHLQELQLWQSGGVRSNAEDGNLAALTALTSLRVHVCMGPHLSRANVTGMHALPQLRELHLDACGGCDLQLLPHLTALSVLTLGALHEQGLPRDEQLPAAMWSQRALLPIPLPPSLQSLRFRGSVGLEVLAAMQVPPSLAAVSFLSHAVIELPHGILPGPLVPRYMETAVAALGARMAGRRQLHVQGRDRHGGSAGPGSGGVTPPPVHAGWLAALSGLRLQQLTLSTLNLGEQDLRVLGSELGPALQALEFRQCNLVEAGLPHLLSLPGLRTLKGSKVLLTVSDLSQPHIRAPLEVLRSGLQGRGVLVDLPVVPFYSPCQDGRTQ